MVIIILILVIIVLAFVFFKKHKTINDCVLDGNISCTTTLSPTTTTTTDTPTIVIDWNTDTDFGTFLIQTGSTSLNLCAPFINQHTPGSGSFIMPYNYWLKVYVNVGACVNGGGGGIIGVDNATCNEQGCGVTIQGKIIKSTYCYGYNNCT